MKNISKKLMASFLILAMMVAMILPTMTFAMEDEDYLNDINGGDDGLPQEGDDGLPREGDDGEEGLEEVTDISQIKLNRKIVFSGTLYKQKLNFNFIKKLFNKKAEETPNYKKEGQYEDQIALVTMILPRQGKVKVAFIKEGKKLATFGYINFADEDLKVSNMIGDAGKYLNVDLNFEDGAKLMIKANGETYPITSETTVEMIKGENGEIGIRIDETVIFDESVELISVGGEVDVNFTERKTTTSGDISIYDKKITVNGTASIAIIENGIEVHGDATVNDKQIAGGTADITYDGEEGVQVEVTEANVGESEVDTSAINTVIKAVINTVKQLVKGILSKLINR